MIPLKLEFWRLTYLEVWEGPPEGVTWNMTRQSDKKRKTVTEGTSCKPTLLYCHTGGRGLESAELRESSVVGMER